MALAGRSIKISGRVWQQTKPIRSGAILDVAVSGIADDAAVTNHEADGA
jgi:hypothetical protein